MDLGSISIQDILALLAPTSPWDYLLYLLILFTLITMFMQGEGALTITILLVVVIVAAFIDKVRVLGVCGPELMLIRILYFVVPAIVAGMTRKANSRVPAIIASVLGLAYTGGTWFFILNSPLCPREPRDTIVLLPLAARYLHSRLYVNGTHLTVELEQD